MVGTLQRRFVLNTSVDTILNTFISQVAPPRVKSTIRTFIPYFIYRIETSHTYPFNGPLSGTTRVSRYQKGKTNLDFTEARDSEWQWHQLGHMQVCTLFQADNHASTPPLRIETSLQLKIHVFLRLHHFAQFLTCFKLFF